jgi:branched-subunit amino acid aminotransferase/4-amino-4-deoxychorismate lyase
MALRPSERRVRWQDLRDADEVFVTNAVVGLKSVAVIERGRERLRPGAFDAADRFRARLELS